MKINIRPLEDRLVELAVILDRGDWPRAAETVREAKERLVEIDRLRFECDRLAALAAERGCEDRMPTAPPVPAALVEIDRPGEPGPAYRAFLDFDRAQAYYGAALEAGRSARLVRLGGDRWEWII